jgi:transcriptional regulator with XRE-family HTH domain
MGSSRRPIPKYLGQKLLQIRLKKEMTQEEMAESLSQATTSAVQPGHVSRFERGTREPSLQLLLAYARLGRVTMDVLADDEVKLPSSFPAVLRSSHRVNR